MKIVVVRESLIVVSKEEDEAENQLQVTLIYADSF